MIHKYGSTDRSDVRSKALVKIAIAKIVLVFFVPSMQSAGGFKPYFRYYLVYTRMYYYYYGTASENLEFVAGLWWNRFGQIEISPYRL